MNRAEMLQQLTQLCRSGIESTPKQIIPSGCKPLDAILPGGGWQSGTVVELMPDQTGIGELSLLMPSLAHMTKSERHVAFIAPPFIPFASALNQHGVRLERLLVINAQSTKDILWCMEQTLRCKSFGVVIAWPSVLVDREIRRLQLSAEAGASIGFVYRSMQAARETSPAAVRLCLRRTEQHSLEVHVLKCRGARAGMRIEVNDWQSREKKIDNPHSQHASDIEFSRLDHTDYSLSAIS